MMTGVIPFATAILSVALMMSVILLLGLGGSADPQQSLRLEGHVQWIGGQTMILATNGMYSYVPKALWSVRVDLTRVPQDEYHTLTQGDLVTVSFQTTTVGSLGHPSSGAGPGKLSRHSTAP